MHRSFLLATAAGAAILSTIAPTLAQSNSSTAAETVTVTAEQLNAARSGIQTQIGASTYTVSAADLENAPGGDGRERGGA